MSNDYWVRREHEHLQKLAKEQQSITNRINNQYERAMDEITKEINNFYMNYAGKEGISIANAKKKAKEIDVQAFARKAKEYVKNKDFSSEANRELRLYNLTMKVNRLELLKSKIALELVSVANEQYKQYERYLKQTAIDEYKRQSGILGETVGASADKVNQIVRGSYKNATFSERIWVDQAVLQNKLDSLIEKSIMQGKHPSVLAREIRNLVITDPRRKKETAQYLAERLLQSEVTRLQTQVQFDSYEQAGFDEYIYIAEPGHCPICGMLNGRHFKIKNEQPGENSPPIHPWCRCSTAACTSEILDIEKMKANRLLREADRHEEQVTGDLKRFAKASGFDLSGLEFRMKTEGSLTRKIKNEPDGKKIRDVLRYTGISDGATLTENYNRFIELLRNNGYNETVVKNYWNNKGNPYNGINTFVKTKDGYEFEMQYHTKESFDLKNGKLHELYEKQRVIKDKRSEEYLELEDLMFELSESLKRPINIDSIKEV